MNNLLFGDPTFGGYETIGGGAGATPCALGRNTLHRADGTIEQFDGRAQFLAQPGAMC